METSQLYLNCCKVGNTLSGCLMYLLETLFRDCRTDFLLLLLRSLHLCELGLNQGCNDECLIDPWLYARLQDIFLMSRNVYLLLECFFLLHPHKPLFMCLVVVSKNTLHK